jgi:hypothetical protein
MFIQNKYYNWYKKLTESRQVNGLIKSDIKYYTEKHHIVPVSLGGSNDKSNLVLLSAREHYLAHWLLTKCLSGKEKFKMVCGFYRLTNQKSKLMTREYNSRQYERARILHSTAKSQEYKGMHMRGALSDEGREKMRENGRKTAKLLKDNIELEMKRRKSLSATNKGKVPHPNSIKNLSFVDRSLGAKHANNTKRYVTGRKTIYNNEIGFPCLKFAAEFANVSSTYLTKLCNDPKHTEWSFA